MILKVDGVWEAQRTEDGWCKKKIRNPKVGKIANVQHSIIEEIEKRDGLDNRKELEITESQKCHCSGMGEERGSLGNSEWME